MSTKTRKRVEAGRVSGKWLSSSRESKAINSAVTIAKRHNRRASRSAVRSGDFDNFSSFEPIRQHMPKNCRCPFCGTPYWFCPC